MNMRREHVEPFSDQALQIDKDNWLDVDAAELIFPFFQSELAICLVPRYPDAE